MQDELSMIWASETSSLEPLQPLSFSVLNDHEESINLDKLSRSEIAGKLLDHLEQQAEGQETEPFDWFANEKSIDLPIFENIPSSIPVGVHNSYPKASSQSYYSYFDSPEYEPTFAPTNYVFAGSAVAEATQPLPTYAPPFNVSPVMTASTNTTTTTTNPAVSINAFAPPARTVPSPHFVACDPKKEVLTPPESPKDEELLRMLQEIVPEDFDDIVFDDDERGEDAAVFAVATPASVDLSSTLSENSCAADDLSDDATSTSYACSESSSDNDADYTPRRSAASRRASVSNVGGSGGGGRKRASKPYSRHSTEERRLRKKEQNKNAATRYRMKKKQEVEECKNEEQRLADRNRELRNKLDDISREIKCLKSLMRDVYRKKGLIK